MMKNAFLATLFCAAALAWGAPASARGLSSRDVVYCPYCAPGYTVIEPGYAASRPDSIESRQVWVWYREQPYTRFDIEGTRVLERMR